MANALHVRDMVEVLPTKRGRNKMVGQAGYVTEVLGGKVKVYFPQKRNAMWFKKQSVAKVHRVEINRGINSHEIRDEDLAGLNSEVIVESMVVRTMLVLALLVIVITAYTSIHGFWNATGSAFLYVVLAGLGFSAGRESKN